MGRIRTLLVTAAAVACPILAQSGGEAGGVIRTAAELSAGKPLVFSASQSVAKDGGQENNPQSFEEQGGGAVNTSGQGGDEGGTPQETEPHNPLGQDADAQPVGGQEADRQDYSGENTEGFSTGAAGDEGFRETAEELTTETEEVGGEHRAVIESVSEGVPAGTLISRNILEYTEEPNAESGTGGAIRRVHYGSSQASDHITLTSGAQVRNLTELSNSALCEAAQQLPSIKTELGSDQPQVLIIHTHTTESYSPSAADSYLSSQTCRTRDSTKNMVAIGETLGRELAARGISVLHDGTIHDYPAYSGAYDRSEETIKAALAEYPSIKLVIDLHRDAIEDYDGTRIAPVTEIEGKSAAQFMIITGCDDGRFGNMPDYMENFKLACLIQDTAGELYPGLARPVLFDYRNYNQHLSTGSLLIEVGGHANSFEEAEYTGKLLGEIIAAAAAELS